MFIIEGLVGAGKTWVLEHFDETNNVGEQKDEFQIVKLPEDVARFNSYKEFAPLSLTQENPKLNAVASQLHIIQCVNDSIHNLVTSLRRETLPPATKRIILLTDRSLYAPLVFSNLIYAEGHISRFTLRFLEDIAEHTADRTCKDLNLKVIGLFFLDTKIRECLKNIQLRRRYYEITRPTSFGFTLKHLYKMRLHYSNHLLWWKQAKGLTNIFKSPSSSDLQYLKQCIEISYSEHKKRIEGQTNQHVVTG